MAILICGCVEGEIDDKARRSSHGAQKTRERERAAIIRRRQRGKPRRNPKTCILQEKKMLGIRRPQNTRVGRERRHAHSEHTRRNRPTLRTIRVYHVCGASHLFQLWRWCKAQHFPQVREALLHDVDRLDQNVRGRSKQAVHPVDHKRHRNRCCCCCCCCCCCRADRVIGCWSPCLGIF